MWRGSNYQSQSATSSTDSTAPGPLTTEIDIKAYFSHESDARAPVFSDVFARVESRFNHLRSVVLDPRARVAAVSVVDGEINAVMQLLHSLRNTMAPIFLIPPEVLSRIFHFLSLKDQPLGYSRSTRTPNLGWIIVTHVCWLWRQVAIDDSSLWARILDVPINKKLVSEMLARARNAQLDINIDLHRASDPKFLFVFSPHLFHTRELRLRGIDTLNLRHLDSVRGICSQEAPALEHFEVKILRNYPTAVTILKPDMKSLFKGRAPKLRTISLFHLFIPWSFIPRRQLTKLEIYHHYEVPASDIRLCGELNQLIDLLANCSELEVLVLESCLYPQSTHSPNGQTIHLPHLSRLHLSGPGSRVTNLFKTLKLPSSTTLQLNCGTEDDSTYNHDLLLPVLSAHLQSSIPIEFKGLSVTISGMNSWLRVTASTSLPKLRISQSEDFECDLENDLVLSFKGLLRKNFIKRVCKILPISGLDFLFIRTDYGTGPVNWVELFKSCAEVTTMQVIGGVTSSLVRALTAPKPPNLANMRRGWKKNKLRHDSGDSTRTHTPIFPKLTSLSLGMLDFGESRPPGILFDVVHNGLRQRRVVYGMYLKILCIGDCAISTKRAKALEKHVEKLLWDGQEEP